MPKKKKAKDTVKERAEAKRLPATAAFEKRVKLLVRAAVINAAFLALLFEFLIAAFGNSDPNAERITRRLANPNRWQRGRMVRSTFRDAKGDLSIREARQMVAVVIAEANNNHTATVAMVQEGLDEMKRLQELESVA